MSDSILIWSRNRVQYTEPLHGMEKKCVLFLSRVDNYQLRKIVLQWIDK